LQVVLKYITLISEKALNYSRKAILLNGSKNPRCQHFLFCFEPLKIIHFQSSYWLLSVTGVRLLLEHLVLNILRPGQYCCFNYWLLIHSSLPLISSHGEALSTTLSHALGKLIILTKNTHFENITVFFPEICHDFSQWGVPH